MKALIDFLPVVVFVVAYVLSGSIFVATAWILAASAAQLTLTWLIWRKFEKIHLFTFGVLLIFGAATLILRDPRFIQWKPTIATWCLAVGFYASTRIGKKPVMERLLGTKMTLPGEVWKNLTVFWSLFFLVSGGANLYVFMNYTESFWVYFKLYGQLGLTLIFLILQSIYISRKVKAAG